MIDVMFFPNGNTAVLRDGKQVPELQKSWLLHFVTFLKEHGIDPLECTITMPDGRFAKLVSISEPYMEAGYNLEILGPQYTY